MKCSPMVQYSKLLILIQQESYSVADIMKKTATLHTLPSFNTADSSPSALITMKYESLYESNNNPLLFNNDNNGGDYLGRAINTNRKILYVLYTTSINQLGTI